MALVGVRIDPLAGCSSCDSVCLDEFVVSGITDRTVDQLSGASVRVCFNDRCTTGTLGSPPDPSSTPIESAELQVEITARVDHGATVVSAGIWGDGTSHALQYHDGDSYIVSIVAASGATVLDATGTATYRTISICGSTCAAFTREL